MRWVRFVGFLFGSAILGLPIFVTIVGEPSALAALTRAESYRPHVPGLLLIVVALCAVGITDAVECLFRRRNADRIAATAATVVFCCVVIALVATIWYAGAGAERSFSRENVGTVGLLLGFVFVMIGLFRVLTPGEDASSRGRDV